MNGSSKNGVLFRADPRLKIICVIILTVMTFLPLRLAAPLGIMVLLFVVSWSAAGLKATLRTIRSVLPVLIVMTLLSPLSERDGEAAVVIGEFVLLTRQALDGLLTISVRFVILTLAFSLLVRTTDQSSLILALRSFGLGFRASLAVSLALGWIPAVSETFRRIEESHALRLDRPQGRRRVGQWIPTLVSALVFAIRRIPLTASVLEQRGLGRDVRPTDFRALRPFYASVIPLLAVGVGAALTGIIFWAG